MIEHSVNGEITSVSTRNGLLKGKLLDRMGLVMKEFTPQDRQKGGVAGDVVMVKELLEAANVTLDGR
jgi:hypothetical protein